MATWRKTVVVVNWCCLICAYTQKDFQQDGGGVTRLDKVRDEYIRGRFKVAHIIENLKKSRLMGYGHIMRHDDDYELLPLRLPLSGLLPSSCEIPFSSKIASTLTVEEARRIALVRTKWCE
ncbi:unnamed protein product [Leptidea sinapis]|uniref:Uncharacterized protein n=1 Tax=Leptidea sinapis TaxID=189913 RepID=A0A5E4PYL4_9NEOP|nr:unnamed protein product [Leptidea sinapis]